MSKKTKRSKRPSRHLVYPRLLEKQISHAQHQMLQGDFADAINTCEPLLVHLPKRSAMRVEVLALLGLAHGMLQHYQESYDIFTEALEIDPTNAELWYNHALACRYTTRVGQAVRDFERAVELSRHDTIEIAHKFAQELEISRKQAQEAMQTQGGQITLDEFIEREECFMRGMDLMKQREWKGAELAFRQLIEMGGHLPQYWGNLGVTLVMQLRYDEAELALRQALEIDPDYAIARNNLEKLPEFRRSQGPWEVELKDLSQQKELKQSISFYKQNPGGTTSTRHTTLEKTGNIVKGTRTPIGKQSPRHRFFLNPYQHERFTICPRCGLKTRTRKFSLVIHVDPIYPLLFEKICRYCYHCDLLILHQDQLEEQLIAHFAVFDPEIIGNDYMVIGTLDRTEWKQGLPDELPTQGLIEKLHDFQEVLTFEPKTSETKA